MEPFLAALPSHASSRPSSLPSSLSIMRGGRGVRAGVTHRVEDDRAQHIWKFGS
jgi:hypothetical protein